MNPLEKEGEELTFGIEADTILERITEIPCSIILNLKDFVLSNASLIELSISY